MRTHVCPNCGAYDRHGRNGKRFPAVVAYSHGVYYKGFHGGQFQFECQECGTRFSTDTMERDHDPFPEIHVDDASSDRTVIVQQTSKGLWKVSCDGTKVCTNVSYPFAARVRAALLDPEEIDRLSIGSPEAAALDFLKSA